MDLVIIKETEDLRDGRNKILRVGLELTVTKELGEKYLKQKVAKIKKPLVEVIGEDLKEK